MSENQNDSHNNQNIPDNDRQKLAAELQQKINKDLESLSQTTNFKDYFKLQREINQKYIGAWKHIENGLERDSQADYELLIKSFGEKAKLDHQNKKIEDKQAEIISKFNEQIIELLNKKDYQKTSEQLFYVLLGNVLDHFGKADVDMKQFDLQKDLYPYLQLPLGLSFFLFQNLTFGPISVKVNDLSKEYLQKYCALLLGLWRIVFELMVYEKQMEIIKKGQTPTAEQDHAHNHHNQHNHK